MVEGVLGEIWDICPVRLPVFSNLTEKVTRDRKYLNGNRVTILGMASDLPPLGFCCCLSQSARSFL